MKVRPILGFAALVLLGGAQLVVDPLLAEPLPGLLGTAVRFGIVALAFLLTARPRGLDWPLVAWSGGLLLTLPVLITAASGSVSGFTELLAFTLIPAGAVFARAQRGGDLMTLLGPSLAGFAGASLVLPYSLPVSFAGRLWLVGLILGALLSGFALVQVAGRLGTKSTLSAAGQIALGSALAAGLFCRVGRPSLTHAGTQDWLVEAARLLVEAALVVLAAWLIRSLGAVRYAARYLLVPLAGVAISFAIERPALGWTLGLGAALMLGSSVMLLQSPPERE